MASERLRRRCAVLGIGMIVNQSIAAAQLIHHICQVAPMYTLMGSLDTHESAASPERHLDRFVRCRRTRDCDQHTDRQTALLGLQL